MSNISDILFIIYLEHLIIFWSYSLLWFMKTTSPIHKNYIKVAKYSLKIQFTIIPLFGIIFNYLYIQFDNNYLTSLPDLSIYELYQWIFMVAWVDFLFYHFHRLLHIPKFYHLHKLHHESITPLPWDALYSSILENILINFLPVFTAPLIVSLKLYYLIIWVAIATLSALVSHSCNLTHHTHIIHHKYFNVNYGVFPIYDFMYGTYYTE